MRGFGTTQRPRSNELVNIHNVVRLLRQGLARGWLEEGARVAGARAEPRHDRQAVCGHCRHMTTQHPQGPFFLLESMGSGTFLTWGCGPGPTSGCWVMGVRGLATGLDGILSDILGIVE